MILKSEPDLTPPKFQDHLAFGAAGNRSPLRGVIPPLPSASLLWQSASARHWAHSLYILRPPIRGSPARPMGAPQPMASRPLGCDVKGKPSPATWWAGAQPFWAAVLEIRSAATVLKGGDCAREEPPGLLQVPVGARLACWPAPEARRSAVQVLSAGGGTGAGGNWHPRLCNRTLLRRHRLSAPSPSFQP